MDWMEIQHLAHLSGLSRVVWHLFVIITLAKSLYLYFRTHFNLLDMCIWLTGDFVLDFWMVAISRKTLQQIVTDNFGILETLKNLSG